MNEHDEHEHQHDQAQVAIKNANIWGKHKCLDHGFIRLVDIMPDQDNCDDAVVQAARVSYGGGTKTKREDAGLINYLMSHAHTTPFEMVELKFHCKMPIFVARQWIRHRTASVNEVSARYSEMTDEYYVPDADHVRMQSSANRQATSEAASVETALAFQKSVRSVCELAYTDYCAALAVGVSREQARMILPVNFYTEWYWKIDLHNLFHFLALRCDSHAQYEIRVFAEEMRKIVEWVAPISHNAWNEHHPMRGAVKFSFSEAYRLGEMLSGRTPTPLTPDRSRQEFASKIARLTTTPSRKEHTDGPRQ